MSAQEAIGLVAVQGELARYSRAADADPLSAGLQRDVALEAINCTLSALTSSKLGLWYNYIDTTEPGFSSSQWRPDIELNSWGAWLINTVKPPPVRSLHKCIFLGAA